MDRNLFNLSLLIFSNSASNCNSSVNGDKASNQRSIVKGEFGSEIKFNIAVGSS